MYRTALFLLLLLLVGPPLAAGPAAAFRLLGEQGHWLRWDAAPRFVDGEERSLDGGLRYSIEGGSYQSLRDQFVWHAGNVPSVEDFEAALHRAFENWTIVDPETGLPASFHFVEDLATPAVDEPGNPMNIRSYQRANPGAEIDIFAATPHAGPGFAASTVLFLDPVPDDLTLTTGATDYPGWAIAGVDIRINTAYVLSLRAFEVLLSHEIGHALGLGDLEFPSGPGGGSDFLDDDYDPSTSATAAATLTNSFALWIDDIDPDATPLQAFTGDMATDPGLESAGAALLMETNAYGDLLYTEPRLQNDEFAGRQFLYPVAVPEPMLVPALGAGAAALAALRARRLRIRGRLPRRSAHAARRSRLPASRRLAS